MVLLVFCPALKLCYENLPQKYDTLKYLSQKLRGLEVVLVDFSLDTSVFELRKEKKNRIPIKYVTIRVLPNHFLMICTPTYPILLLKNLKIRAPSTKRMSNSQKTFATHTSSQASAPLDSNLPPKLFSS